MLLYLVNPSNPLVSMSLNRSSYWNRFRLWKPLGLLVLAGLTPPDWEISDPRREPRLPSTTTPCRGPTSSASPPSRLRRPGPTRSPRGFELGASPWSWAASTRPCAWTRRAATWTRRDRRGEPVWAQVLEDVRAGCLKARYDGGRATMDQIVPARHDLLPRGYALRLHPDHPGLLAQLHASAASPSSTGRAIGSGRSPRWSRSSSPSPRRGCSSSTTTSSAASRSISSGPRNSSGPWPRPTPASRWIGQTTINIADDEELLDLGREGRAAWACSSDSNR